MFLIVSLNTPELDDWQFIALKTMDQFKSVYISEIHQVEKFKDLPRPSYKLYNPTNN